MSAAIFARSLSFDTSEYLALQTTKDPLPNLRKMAEEYSSGYCQVPTIGAGTANTEFEVITGMNLRYFGPGEYPYKTYLFSVLHLQTQVHNY